VRPRASEPARGTKQRAGEPAQFQPGQVTGPEPGQLADLVITDGRGPLDDPRLVNSGDIRDAVPVRVTDLIVRPAEHVQQAHQQNIDAGLLAGLPDRRRSRRFARLDGAAEDTPPVVMAGMTDQQHASRLVHRQDRHRWQQQQLMPDNSPQPGYMRSDTHPATLRP
jgi:hypothetical protein